jgi:hypothetical protein
MSAAMVRGLMVSFSMLGPVAKPADPACLALFDLSRRLVRSLGIAEQADEDALLGEAYTLEARLALPVTLEDAKRWRLQVMFENTQTSFHLRDVLAHVQAERDQAWASLVRTQTEIQSVYASRSWRITRPLRDTAQLLRRILAKV